MINSKFTNVLEKDLPGKVLVYCYINTSYNLAGKLLEHQP